MKKPIKYHFGEFRVQCLREPDPQIDTQGPRDLNSYWHTHIVPSASYQPDKEHCVVVLQNMRRQTIGWNLVSMGGLNSADVHPREVLRPAIVGAAASICLIHNHPSGDPTPSDADRRITKRIREACEIIGIPLHDHLIIGHADSLRHLPFFSFREHGLI